MTEIRLAEVQLPDFGNPVFDPVLPPAVFAARIARCAHGWMRTASMRW